MDPEGKQNICNPHCTIFFHWPRWFTSRCTAKQESIYTMDVLFIFSFSYCGKHILLSLNMFFQHPLDHRKSKRVQQNIYFCFIDYAKAFDCVNHNKLWKILKEMGIPDHLTCLFRNLYAGQEATVRIGNGTIDWFHIGKGVRQGYILSTCLFNLYAECINVNCWVGWSTSWNQDCQEE